MLSQFRPALVLIVLMTLLTGLAYPLAVTGIAGVLFPYRARGSLVAVDGRIVGSELIGQDFTQAKYFHPRPSATVTTDPADPARTMPLPYNAAASGGSNLGPTSRALVERVATATAALRRDGAGPIPIDLVTASASGLDPDISPASAEFQAARVAAARNLPVERVRALIAAATEDRFLSVIGEPRVNVLKLNMALDAPMAK